MASTPPPAAPKPDVTDSPEVELGEIEEGQDVVLDGAKFDEMRTVFQDPQTFNVKVSSHSIYPLIKDSLSLPPCYSTLCILRGRSGSTRPTQRAKPSPRRRLRLCPLPRAACLLLQAPSAGWTTLND